MKSNFGFLKFMALLEGSSLLLLLLVAVPMKHMLDIPQAVSIIGPVHGVLFIAFNAVLFSHLFRGHLGSSKTALGFVASLIPFGTFVYKAKALKTA